MSRELDAEIAEKVFHENVIETDDCNGVDNLWIDPQSEHELPFFSTDIAAAWLVVEKLNCHIVLTVDPKDIKPRYAVVYLGGRKVVGGDAQAETMPLAICRAALAALDKQAGGQS